MYYIYIYIYIYARASGNLHLRCESTCVKTLAGFHPDLIQGAMNYHLFVYCLWDCYMQDGKEGITKSSIDIYIYILNM